MVFALACRMRAWTTFTSPPLAKQERCEVGPKIVEAEPNRQTGHLDPGGPHTPLMRPGCDLATDLADQNRPRLPLRDVR